MARNSSRGKNFTGIIVFIMILLIFGLAAFFYFSMHQADATFTSKTMLGDTPIGGMTPDEVTDQIAAQFPDFPVQIMENDEIGIEGKASDFGYTFNTDLLRSTLKEAHANQHSNPLNYYKSLIFGDTIVLETAYDYDESVFQNFVKSENLSEPRRVSSKARLKLNKAGTRYHLKEPVQGNEIDDKQFQTYVSDQLKKYIHTASSGSEPLVMSVPEDVYTSEIIDMDTTALRKKMKKKNMELKRVNTFKDMSVTYLFGDVTETITGDMILEWVSYDKKGNFQVDQDAAAAYISNLADQYDTIWRSRDFVTSYGETITFSSDINQYGYCIAESSELWQLTEDILAAEPIAREPIYYSSNEFGNPYYLYRNGYDDVCGTYVEVNLSAQHVWFYKWGDLIIDSDCVTGNTSKDAGTYTGVYPLAYKESPSVLEGGSGKDKYSSKVNYWMPFNQGQGLHDANWRSSFGGSIYETDGSHGCVNLPPSTAEVIYNNIEVGTAIFVHW